MPWWRDGGMGAPRAGRAAWGLGLAGNGEEQARDEWRLDRLARSVRHALELAETFEAQGVGLRSLTEQLDTTTPGGRLIFTVFAAMAEFERNLLRERTAAGLAAARERGRVGGRKPALSAEQVATARLLLEQGRTVVDVARILHVSRRTIYRALERAGAEQVAMA